MKRGRRGQEGMTLGTLAGIVLVAVVVIVVILFFTGTFDRIGQGRDALPGQLEVVAQSCILAAQSNLVTDYCYTFKKVSDEQYVNCQDARIEQSLIAEEVSASFNCDGKNALGGDLVDDAKREICLDASVGDQTKVYFNGDTGETCASLFPGLKDTNQNQ